MAKKGRKRRPTVFQAQTLRQLLAGWELIDTPNRLYWEVCLPSRVTPLNPKGLETIECGYPKVKRYSMSHLERYGWVMKTKTGWVITPAGEAVLHSYDAWIGGVLSTLKGNSS